MRSIGIKLPEGWRRLVDPAWLEGWEPRSFPLAGGATEVVAMGDGPVVLLLPPLPGYKEAFAGVARLLARRFRVVSYDLRARFEGRPAWEAHLQDLDRIVESFAPSEPLALVGHSLGGALAQRWALAHPERVAALVLSSGFAKVGTAPGHRWKRYLEQPLVLAGQRYLPERLARPLARRLAARGGWVYDPRCDDRVLDFVRLGIRAVGLGEARRCVSLAMAHDMTAKLAELTCPTLLLVGERETTWGRTAAADLGRLMPHAESRVVPRVSHLHPLSAPEAFAEAVGDWLAMRHAPTGPGAS